MKYIFISFYGWPEPEMKQKNKIFKIEKNFECWNLRKFTLSEFIDTIKERIPPVNKNVLSNYISKEGDLFGTNEEIFSQCLWGLLLPHENEKYQNDFIQILSLLNLYSNYFLTPAFYVNDFGITKVSQFDHRTKTNNDQSYQYFKTKKFVKFYNKMISEMKYFQWHSHVVSEWDIEDWMLYMACSFFSELKKYQEEKNFLKWQRESAEMATLLEILFSSQDEQKELITYKLKKRISAMIGWQFTDIEKDINDLYNDRSQFVHGSYYKKIAKKLKKDELGLMPDFDKLYKTKEQIRFIIVAYLYLHKIKNLKLELLFKKYKNTQELLENAIIDIQLRKKIINTIKQILKLMP